MKHLLLACFALLLLACTTRTETEIAVPMPVFDWATNDKCLHIEPPTLQHKEGEVIHQYWEFDDDPALRLLDHPEFYATAQFIEAVEATSPTPNPFTLGASGQWDDAANDSTKSNSQLVFEGVVGKIRPINCLEAHLFDYQAARFDMLEQPTEFHGFILRRDSAGMKKIKVYFTASNEMFPPKPKYAVAAIEVDVQNGWELYAHLHNHNFDFTDSTDIMYGPTAPSKPDAHYYKALVARFNLQYALVTNGVNTVQIEAGELELLNSD